MRSRLKGASRRSRGAPLILHDPINILVLGTTFTGKSYLAAKSISWSPQPHVIVLHTKFDYSYLDQLSPKYTRILRVLKPYPLSKRYFKDKRVLFCVITGLHERPLAQFLVEVVNTISSIGNCLFIIDEAHIFLKRNQVPYSLVSFIRASRHFYTDVVMVTHRLTDIHPDIRAVITHLAVFRTVGALNFEVLKREFLGDQAPIEEIKNLRKYHYLWVDMTAFTYEVETPA